MATCLLCSFLVLACTEPLPPSERCKKQDVSTDGFGPVGKIPIKVEVVVKGLTVPWGLGFLPDGSMLISERGGTVRLFRKGTLLEKPVLTLDVAPSSEGGLLGLALHPRFSTNRWFYLYYTAKDDNGETWNRVIRATLAKNYESAASTKTILDKIPSAIFHNGGRLRFGPDDKLYIGTGDARKPELSQDRTNTAGKLLRINEDGSIPADNPFEGSSVFLWGIRNTQGFDWVDKDTLIVTDHGPSGDTGRVAHDEVTLAQKGANLGWPTIYACESKEKLLSPIITWTTAVPPGGAALYTGDAIPEWKGSLLIGSLRSKHLHRVEFDRQTNKLTSHEVYLKGDVPKGYGRLREVIMGPDGHLYVTTSNCDGRGLCGKDKDLVLKITK